MSEKRKIGPWIESGYLGHGTFGMVRLWCNEVFKLVSVYTILHSTLSSSNMVHMIYCQSVSIALTLIW